MVGSAWTPWVRPTHRVSAWLEGTVAQRVAVGAGAGDDDLARVADLQCERGVENVGGRQAVMDPASGVSADRVGDDVHECRDVVVGGAFALGDRFDFERGLLARPASRPPAGTTPSAAHASVAASSTASQPSIFRRSVQTAPISA